MNIVKVVRVLFLRGLWLVYFNFRVKVVDQINVFRGKQSDVVIATPDRRLERQLADAYFTADYNLAKSSK